MFDSKDKRSVNNINIKKTAYIIKDDKIELDE